MAEKRTKEQKKGLLSRMGLDGGIRRRWFINNMSVVILILLLVGTLVAMFCTYYFYASVQTRLERTDAAGVRTVAITNTTSLSYTLRINGDNPFILDSFNTAFVQVAADGKLMVSVENMWCGEEEHPVVELEF